MVLWIALPCASVPVWVWVRVLPSFETTFRLVIVAFPLPFRLAS